MQQQNRQADITRNEWIFLWSLPVTFFLIIGICYGRNALASRHAAQVAAAQALRESQDAAVQRRMTVFPPAPKREVKSKMADYVVSGAGVSAYNGTYTYTSATLYTLDASHYLAVDGNNNWALSGVTTPGLADDDYVSSGVYPTDTPDVGTWSPSNAAGPAPTVTELVVDTTAPVVDTGTGVSIDSTGLTLTVPWTEAGSPPVTGSTGLSLVGMTHGAVTLGSVSTSSLTTTATLSRALYSDETVTLSYTPGNFADSNGTPNAVASFSGTAITNGSTVTWDGTAPVPASASIAANGTDFTLSWTETGSAPVTGSTGLTLSGLTHGTATIGSVSTSGTTTTGTISRKVYSDETPTLVYTPGNFADSFDTPNAADAFSGQAITNNSTQMWDGTKPIEASASVATNGTTLTINWTETGSPPIVGTTGLSLSNLTPAVTLSSISNSSTTTTATISRALYGAEVPKLNYTPGDFADSFSPANTVVAFSGLSVTNNSTQKMPSLPIYNAVTETGVEVSQDRGAATSKGYIAILHVAPDYAGTTPTLDVIIEHSADGGADADKTWATLCTFTQMTANGVQRLVSTSDTTTVNQYVRASHTLGGTTPKFAYTLELGTRQ